MAKPSAIPSVTAVRIDDGRQNVRWTYGTASPRVLAFELERYTNYSQQWYRWASNISPSARSHAMSGTTPETKVHYRMRVRNADGVSAWTYATEFYTTPHAPTDVTARWQGTPNSDMTGDVLISWTNRSTLAQRLGIRMRSRPPGGRSPGTRYPWSEQTWVPYHNGLDPTTTSRLITGLSTSYEYEFEVVAEVRTPVLYAPTAVVLQPVTPPARPTTINPRSYVRAGTITFSWKHNPTDGSPQTGFLLTYKNRDTDESLAVSGTTETSATVTGIPAGRYEWTVMTRGLDRSWSEVSALGYFEAANPPTVTITAPKDSYAGNKVDIRAIVPSNQVITKWEAELFFVGELVERASGTGLPNFKGFKYTLLNNQEYSWRLRVQESTGIWSSWADATFTTSFVRPNVPVVQPVWWPDTGELSVTVTNPSGGVNVVRNLLQRRDGTRWVTVADMEPGEQFNDVTAPLNSVVEYRAIAISGFGAERPSEVTTVHTDSVQAFVRYGPDLSQMVVMECGLIVESAMSTTSTSHLFSQRALPVTVYSGSHTSAVTISASAMFPGKSMNELEQMLREMQEGDVWWRDHEGRSFMARISAPKITGARIRGFPTVSFTAEQVDGSL